MYDFLAHATRRGESTPAGETIGRTAEERLEARQKRHPTDPGEQVWRIDFP